MAGIREVARLAGVSPATVSRVMNGTAHVEEEKRRRVQKVIEETGFKPNEVARALFKRSSRVIGVIVPDIVNPFFNEMAKAIEGEAYRQGYRMMLCCSENRAEKERESIRILVQMNADGIILMTNNEEVEQDVKASAIPVVLLDRQLPRSCGIACIQADNYEGGKLAAEYLIRCGCRQLINVCGPRRFSSARQRYLGYEEVCRRYGREIRTLECEYSFEAGVQAGKEILERWPEADGIMACDDMVAAAICKVLKKAGRQIPDEVQLIGFDGVAFGTMFAPELTTVAQPIDEMGKAAVEWIIHYVEEKEIGKDQIFPVHLVKRETTREKEEEQEEQNEDFSGGKH